MSNSDLTWSERANWGLLIGGAAMGACSILFFVLGTQVAQIRVSFFLTGVIMAASGALLLRMGWANDDIAKDDRRIRENGVPGTATIVAVAPTGLVVKKQPQVEMQLRLVLPDKPPYLIRHTEVVPASVADTLTAGRPLRVSSDPADPLRIVIGTSQELDPRNRSTIS